MKREEFWLAKRKNEIYTYKSARLLKEPFKTVNAETNESKSNLINILGLILSYNEKDSTVSVLDMSKVLHVYSQMTGCTFTVEGLEKYRRLPPPSTQSTSNLTSISFRNNSHFLPEFPEFKAIANKTMFKNENHYRHERRSSEISKCDRLYKTLRANTKKIRNFQPYWSQLWQRVVGIVDYVDPIQAVLRTWDLKFAVLPCQLKWSNNLMMVLPQSSSERPQQPQDEGKCLKFTSATEGELFVVIASTPSDQNTWYIFQVTTKGVIFYKVHKLM